VYSVFKEVDFGTSLINGPFSNTNIADAFREADAAGEETFVEGWCRDNSRIVRTTNPSQNDAQITPAQKSHPNWFSNYSNAPNPPK
jgi:hypothetical protein